eukprot:1604843-Rhodomonas_salina.2
MQILRRLSGALAPCQRVVSAGQCCPGISWGSGISAAGGSQRARAEGECNVLNNASNTCTQWDKEHTPVKGPWCQALYSCCTEAKDKHHRAYKHHGPFSFSGGSLLCVLWQALAGTPRTGLVLTSREFLLRRVVVVAPAAVELFLVLKSKLGVGGRLQLGLSQLRRLVGSQVFARNAGWDRHWCVVCDKRAGSMPPAGMRSKKARTAMPGRNSEHSCSRG